MFVALGRAGADRRLAAGDRRSWPAGSNWRGVRTLLSRLGASFQRQKMRCGRQFRCPTARYFFLTSVIPGFVRPVVRYMAGHIIGAPPRPVVERPPARNRTLPTGVPLSRTQASREVCRASYLIVANRTLSRGPIVGARWSSADGSAWRGVRPASTFVVPVTPVQQRASPWDRGKKPTPPPLSALTPTATARPPCAGRRCDRRGRRKKGPRGSGCGFRGRSAKAKMREAFRADRDILSNWTGGSRDGWAQGRAPSRLQGRQREVIHGPGGPS